MILTNIKQMENKMALEKIDIAFFTIRYVKCDVECIYSKDLKRFLFAIVDKNIGFTRSLKNGQISAFIEDKDVAQALADCRNKGGWKPSEFFEVLNNNLPNVHIEETTSVQYKKVASVSMSNFEDRIYFNHWKRANISKKQEDKTAELMGYEVLDFCKKTKITPVYYPYPTDRTMKVMENFFPRSTVATVECIPKFGAFFPRSTVATVECIPKFGAL